MALDTTVGGASADSYATLAEYQAYADAYGWNLAGSDADDEINLRKGRKYIDNAYIWKGRRTASTQALEWPRIITQYVEGFAVSSEAIPEAIKQAQIEMAHYIQVRGSDPFAVVETGGIRRKREKVDVIERETEYATSREREAYPSVDNLVLPYAERKAGVISASFSLSRA